MRTVTTASTRFNQLLGTGRGGDAADIAEREARERAVGAKLARQPLLEKMNKQPRFREPLILLSNPEAMLRAHALADALEVTTDAGANINASTFIATVLEHLRALHSNVENTSSQESEHVRNVIYLLQNGGDDLYAGGAALLSRALITYLDKPSDEAPGRQMFRRVFAGCIVVEELFPTKPVRTAAEYRPYIPLAEALARIIEDGVNACGDALAIRMARTLENATDETIAGPLRSWQTAFAGIARPDISTAVAISSQRRKTRSGIRRALRRN